MIVRILDFDWQVITGSPTAPKGNDNNDNNTATTNTTNTTTTNNNNITGSPTAPKGREDTVSGHQLLLTNPPLVLDYSNGHPFLPFLAFSPSLAFKFFSHTH